MSAYYESIVVLSGANEESSTLLGTLDRMLARCVRWSLERKEDGILEYHVPFNLWSFGEKVRITLEVQSVRVESWGSQSLQLIDWGKNRKNVQRVRSCIREIQNSYVKPT